MERFDYVMASVDRTIAHLGGFINEQTADLASLRMTLENSL